MDEDKLVCQIDSAGQKSGVTVFVGFVNVRYPLVKFAYLVTFVCNVPINAPYFSQRFATFVCTQNQKSVHTFFPLFSSFKSLENRHFQPISNEYHLLNYLSISEYLL